MRTFNAFNASHSLLGVLSSSDAVAHACWNGVDDIVMNYQEVDEMYNPMREGKTALIV